MKTKQLFAIALSFAFALTGCAKKPADANGLAAFQTKYLENIDIEYSFSLAKELETYKTNELLGYRTAGSEAELLTGDMLVEEMKTIGLQDVTKDKITLDTWDFEKATLKYTDAKGVAHEFTLGGYQINIDTKGFKDFELVYANKGTMNDLANIDVKDKLILIEINQRAEWWVTYPAIEAHLAGAAGVLVYQNGGYAEISDEALNTQDICGPDDAPIFSISRKDANVIMADMETSTNKQVKVSLDAKSTVGFDGTSYNIVGTIPGKDPNSMVLLSAHYDSYFSGFQDDNAAIAMMMGIAKATIDSGYQPEKTLVFVAMAAEEWGVSNTRYDWSTGAYNQIFRVRPDWVGKVVANINFELPAYEHTETSEMRSSYEFATFLNEFKNIVPLSDKVFDNGISVVYPTRTWSDDFSMSIAGVPAIRNDFEDSPFMSTHYHSQFDTADTYNPDVYDFHHRLYGLLMLEYDRSAVVPLDFSTRMNTMKDSLDLDVAQSINADVTGLVAALDQTSATASAVYTQLAQSNKDYKKALLNKKDASKILADSKTVHQSLLSTFKYAEDNLTRLTWEDNPIFPHQHYQNNIKNLQLSIEALKSGDVATPVDEYLWMIDNNWYAYEWSKETYRYFTDYVLYQDADRLMWGAGRVLGHIDLYDTIQSLLGKYDAQNADVTKEIAVLEAALAEQIELYKSSITEEISIVNEINGRLSQLKQ